MDIKEILTTVALIAIIMVIYYITYAQRKKQDKELKEIQNNLKKGDKIITFSGLSGEIEEIVEDRVIVSTNPDKVKLSVEKWAIAGIDDRAI